MASLKVIALISGGKDSFFSMVHCISQGHEVVALANLHPAGDDNDIDSFMFQTVGHNVIPLYAEALELPLYRAPILGNNSVKARDYAVQVDRQEQDVDETESLMPLLMEVSSNHPEANAVSSGAILSSYQRTRVESVALRLGLTPLAFLWQYPYLPPYRQSSLLLDMAAVGQISRIIKVSSGGLDERHLWLDVCDDKVARAMVRYGDATQVGAILGEGGEFETLAIDGPSPLWKARVQVDDDHRLANSGDGSSAMLAISKARTMGKERSDKTAGQHLRRPDLLDVEFLDLKQRLDVYKSHLDVKQWGTEVQQVSNPGPSNVMREERQSLLAERLTVDQPVSYNASGQLPDTAIYHSSMTLSAETGTGHLSNVCWKSDQAHKPRSKPENIGKETELAMDNVRQSLVMLEAIENQDLHNVSYCRSSAIAFTVILLRSMSDFAAVNAVYSTLFSTPKPPARVTVACGECMPRDINVMMSFFIHDIPSQERDGLHVQSRSYWAPANIGPYSQAISVPTPEPTMMTTSDEEELNTGRRGAGRIVYVAGQIPLVPATMELVFDDFVEQAILSLQHLWRIGRAMGVHLWANVIVYITASSHEEAQERASIAGKLWRMMHMRAEVGIEEGDDEEEFDVGDKHLYRSMGRMGVGEQDYDKVYRPPLPDWNRTQVDERESRNAGEGGISPPCAVLQVAELPRGAAIEWAGIGCRAGDDQKIRLTGNAVELDRWSCTLDTLTERKNVLGGPTTEYFVKHGYENQDWSGMIVPCRGVFDGYGNEHIAMARKWQQGSGSPFGKAEDLTRA